MEARRSPLKVSRSPDLVDLISSSDENDDYTLPCKQEVGSPTPQETASCSPIGFSASVDCDRGSDYVRSEDERSDSGDEDSDGQGELYNGQEGLPIVGKKTTPYESKEVCGFLLSDTAPVATKAPKFVTSNVSFVSARSSFRFGVNVQNATMGILIIPGCQPERRGEPQGSSVQRRSQLGT